VTAFTVIWIGIFLVAGCLSIAMVARRLQGGWSAQTRKLGLALIVLGVLAPAFGFVSTVIGLSGAFGAVEGVAPADKATALAAGISEAMNGTVFGIATAGPAFLLGLWGFVKSRRAP
jgi:hypothetical protein